MDNHYIDNQKLLEELILCKKNKKISNELGNYFILLAEKLSFHKNYIKTYDDLKEEMISQSILVLCENYYKFDETKYSNPFAYLTQIVRWSFTATYKKYYKKHKNLRDNVLSDILIDYEEATFLNIIS